MLPWAGMLRAFSACSCEHGLEAGMSELQALRVQDDVVLQYTRQVSASEQEIEAGRAEGLCYRQAR